MTSVWDDVVGQATVVTRLRRALDHPTHAYLFVGPPGGTKHEAARAFAAELLTGDDDPSTRDARLILAGEHPDVREVSRVGPAISMDQAREIVRLSSFAPNEGDRKVMVLHEFHLLRPEAAAALLKTIEEPPPSTTFVILADRLSPELVTIASRCARIDFQAIDDTELADRLVLEGVDPESAREAADAAGGDIARARILAGDPELSARRRAFAEAPARLDGTGAVVMTVVAELLAMVDRAAEPLMVRHAGEVAELDERIARFGERGSGKKTLEERHKRELRRHRTDELRSGLAQMARAYRDALVDGHLDRPESAETAVRALHTAIEMLDRNPNEALQLQALLWSLPPLQRIAR